MAQSETGKADRWRVEIKGIVGFCEASHGIEADVRMLPSEQVEAKPQDVLRTDEDYAPTKRRWLEALAPAISLAAVIATMVAATLLVGYTAVKVDDGTVGEVSAALAAMPTDEPARRAALAYSGVTMAITVALSFTSGIWARGAARAKDPAYLKWVRTWVWCSFGIGFLVIAAPVDYKLMLPYSTKFGQELMHPDAARMRYLPACAGPYMMFVLAWLVPTMLAFGASLMLQPMADPTTVAVARAQLAVLAERFKELDQLLYIGAMTLVFGTLQLSAAMSVPLASWPTSASVKARADLCKAISPPEASNSGQAANNSTNGNNAVDTSKPASATKVSGSRSPCENLQAAAVAAELGDGLRRLVKGVTFSFGLAFSALLAAIYVPAATVLRGIMRTPARWRDAVNDQTGKSDGPSAADADPVGRLIAIAATLSPLFAGVLANAIA